MFILGIIIACIVFVGMLFVLGVICIQKRDDIGSFYVKREQHNSGRNPFSEQKEFEIIEYFELK